MKNIKTKKEINDMIINGAFSCKQDLISFLKNQASVIRDFVYSTSKEDAKYFSPHFALTKSEYAYSRIAVFKGKFSLYCYVCEIIEDVIDN